MKCPKCQHENPDDARFCMRCSHNLTFPSEPAAKDLSFNEKLEKIQRYLPKGLAEKVLSQRDKIEGERKQVTVMFCDMEGFTSLVEKLGPEEAYSIMDDIYEILIHKVHDYEGTVNEMTGDGIMALFGAPIALEDAPQRAIRSALSIHREIAEFNDKQKGIKPIKMRIGVHNGPVVVGTLGNDLRVEFKAVGDTVNLASRMESLAVPGTTYVTEDTFKLTKGLFRFESLGGIEVKGKEEKVLAYKVLSGKEDVYRPRLGAERMIYSEMVGRDKDLDRLELQVMKAVSGEGSVVNIIGEAGIGKSRLVAEMKNQDVMKKVALLEGKAISMGRNLSFHPIIDLLKHWARIRENDSKTASLNKLEAAIRQVYQEEIHEVLPFVATLMGMRLSGRYAERVKGITGEALEKLILKNVRELLIKATEMNPLVIVMEDLHWADMSSIELIESLFRLAESQRILFVNVFRPGHKETGDRIVETIKEKLPGYYVEIAPQPLDERMSEALINNMLNITGLHHAVMDRIVKRADGNPFFIEEVVRSLIDEGAVVVKDGSYEVTEKIDTVVIPHTIHDVLMARIDRLEEKTRDLVKVASIIGRNFFYRVLAEVARTIEDIDSRLSYLKEIQLIRERKRMEEIEYLFKHALAQEVAYESILVQKRKVLHLKVADSIEKVFSEKLREFYGMLSYHYSSGDNLDKAEEYMIKAGEEAMKASASSEALNYFQEGLKLYRNKCGDAVDPEKLTTFEKNIALAFHNKGKHGSAIEYFDRVLRRWGVRSPRNRMAIVVKVVNDLLIIIINLYLPWRKSKKIASQRDNEINFLSTMINMDLAFVDNARMFAEVIANLRRNLKFDMTSIGNSGGLLAGLAVIFSDLGFLRLGNKLLEHSEGVMDKNDITDVITYCGMEQAFNLCTGKWTRSKHYDQTSVDLALKNGLFWSAAIYIYFSGRERAEQGEFSEVELLMDKLYEVGEEYYNDNARIYHRYLKIDLLIKKRRAHEAKVEANETVSWTHERGMEVVQLHYFGFKAIGQIMLGDVNGAKETIFRANELIRNQGKLLSTFKAPIVLAQFLTNIHILKQSIASGNLSDLTKHRKKAYKSGKVALRNAHKYAPRRTWILSLMGSYYWLIVKQRKALKWWDRAIREGERLGARVDLSRTYFEVGKRLLDPQSKYRELNGLEAKGYLEKATILFEEMGLERDLDDLYRFKDNYGL